MSCLGMCLLFVGEPCQISMGDPIRFEMLGRQFAQFKHIGGASGPCQLSPNSLEPRGKSRQATGGQIVFIPCFRMY